ncbi:hypothetical protein FALBO_13550 [Fusarium albosuccineum]|uniref:Uncharacterized protein n=1 Tax=Fusarium albosuccineum TaxID=1237068 RepID=A0A8H4KYA8_9HYPO|nr:hypothetical protein FALBO_13550 [Fusarium albosuccineum]
MDPQPPGNLNSTIRKKRRDRASALALLTTPEASKQKPRIIQSPSKLSPALRSAPAITPPDFVARSASTASHQRNTSVTSLDTTGSLLGASLPAVGNVSIRYELPEERAESTETVRGSLDRERGATPPLTPFPPFLLGPRERDEEAYDPCVWEGSMQLSESVAHGKRQSYDGGHVPVTVMRIESRWVINSVMHGFVLALQFVVALGVFGALMWVTVWKENEPGNDFAEWLWTFADPILVALLLLCSATLLAHETKLLSSVALLYLQSLILVVTTIASLILWTRCFQEQSPAVKGVLMGCNVLMWGLALFGFLRAVVLWKVEATEERGMDVERRFSYGTFVSLNAGDERRESV